MATYEGSISAVKYEAWLDQASLSPEQKRRLSTAVPATQFELRNNLATVLNPPGQPPKGINKLLLDFETFRKIEAFADQFVDDILTISRGEHTDQSFLVEAELYHELIEIAERERDTLDVRNTNIIESLPHAIVLAKLKLDREANIEAAVAHLNLQWPPAIDEVPLDLNGGRYYCSTNDKIVRLLKIAYEVNPVEFQNYYRQLVQRFEGANQDNLQSTKMALFKFMLQKAGSDKYCYEKARLLRKELKEEEKERESVQISNLTLELFDAARQQARPYQEVSFCTPLISKHLHRLDLETLIHACAHYPQLYTDLETTCIKTGKGLSRIYLIAVRLGKDTKKLKKKCEKQLGSLTKEESDKGIGRVKNIWKTVVSKGRQYIPLVHSILTPLASKQPPSAFDLIDYAQALTLSGFPIPSFVSKVTAIIKETKEESHKMGNERQEEGWELKRQLQEIVNRVYELAEEVELEIPDIEGMVRRGHFDTPGKCPPRGEEAHAKYIRRYQKYISHPEWNAVVEKATKKKCRLEVETASKNPSLTILQRLSEIADLSDAPLTLDDETTQQLKDILIAAFARDIDGVPQAEREKKAATLVYQCLNDKQALRATRWALEQNVHLTDEHDLNLLTGCAPALATLSKKEVEGVATVWHRLRQCEMAELKPEFIALTQQHAPSIAALGIELSRSIFDPNVTSGRSREWEAGIKKENAGKLINHTFQIIQQAGDHPAQLIAVAIYQFVLKNAENQHRGEYRGDYFEYEPCEERNTNCVNSILTEVAAIPGRAEFRANPPDGIDSKDFDLACIHIIDGYNGWTKSSDEKVLEFMQLAERAPGTVQRMVDEYKNDERGARSGYYQGKATMHLSTLIAISKQISPEEAAEITIQLTKSGKWYLEKALKIITEDPDSILLLKNGILPREIYSFKDKQGEVAAKKVVKILTRAPHKRKRMRSMIISNPQNWKLVCQAAETLPPYALGDFESRLRSVPESRPITTWAQAQPLLLGTYDGRLDPQTVAEKTQLALESDWFLTQQQITSGLSQKTFNAGMDRMSHIEREEAFTKGYESLVELHLQQEEQKKAKSQQPAATVEEQPPVLKASDYHLSKEQLNNLLALARAYGKHQKTICHLLIENWKDLRHGNFLEQVHQIYASEKTAVGHSRSDIHEIINRLATNWEELQDGRYVVFMNELNALCAPEDRDISREYGKLAVTLGKNWKFLKNEEHLSFLKYLRNSERLRGHYMRAIGGHKQGYDDPRRFYRGPLPTEEIVSIQAAFMSYFDLDEQDGVAFDTFEDSQFKGLKNLDPQYRKRFKELIKSLHQERREKLVYLAAYKDINKHFAFFEELVEHSKEKSQIAENASLLWDACHTKPERLPHAIKAITDIKPFDGTFHDRYIDALMGEGEAAAQAYHQATIKKAKGLNDPATAPALRSDEEYNWMVRYIYPDGNFSSYETNRQCEDHPEHLEGYEFDPEGYPIRLSGLLGYSVKEGKEENTGLLDSYKKRLHAVRNFIDTRHARNESLQTAFQKEVDEAFAKYAHPRFKTLEPITTPVETPPEGEHKLSDAVDNPRTGLTVKEKLLCLFITEVIRKIEASGRAQQDSERKEKMLTPEATEAVVILNDEIKSLLDELKDCSPERTTEINGTLRDLRAQKGSLEGRDVNENYELNTQILDLMVIYHYVFNEHLEPYIVRSADVVKAEQDPVAQNYLHWQELSNIYGENIKHALRHDFSGQSSSDLPQLGNITSTYKAIIQAAAASGIISQEQIKDRQKEAIVTNIIQNDKIPADRKYTVLCKKINQMVLGPLKLSKEEREELKAAVEETLKPFRSAPTVETLNQLIPSIYSLRAPYRVKFESKMEELFTHDINLINIEISKYKENSETDMKETRMGGEKHKAVTKSKKSRNIRGRYMKTRESANARMGAYLCIAGDKKMYEDPNYFEQVYFDEDTSECVGLTMHINIEAKDGKKYLWFGPNPFESFLDKVSARKCLEFQYQQVCQFADRNGYDGVVIPSAENRILGECTNRGGMFPDLIKQRRLREEDGKLKIVQFGGSHTIGRHGGSAYSYTDGALIWERAAA